MICCYKKKFFWSVLFLNKSHWIPERLLDKCSHLQTTRVTTRDNTTRREYNTRQHDTMRVQHQTTRHNTSTTRVKHEHNTTQHEYNTTQHEITRDNTSTIQHNTSTTWPNSSTTEVLAAKIGLYFALFVTELYIFLISFRNS